MVSISLPIVFVSSHRCCPGLRSGDVGVLAEIRSAPLAYMAQAGSARSPAWRPWHAYVPRRQRPRILGAVSAGVPASPERRCGARRPRDGRAGRRCWSCWTFSSCWRGCSRCSTRPCAWAIPRRLRPPRSREATPALTRVPLVLSSLTQDSAACSVCHLDKRRDCWYLPNRPNASRKVMLEARLVRDSQASNRGLRPVGQRAAYGTDTGGPLVPVPSTQASHQGCAPRPPLAPRGGLVLRGTT